MLNNSMCAWLTIYLNRVHMTYQIYFLGNPINISVEILNCCPLQVNWL